MKDLLHFNNDSLNDFEKKANSVMIDMISIVYLLISFRTVLNYKLIEQKGPSIE